MKKLLTLVLAVCFAGSMVYAQSGAITIKGSTTVLPIAQAAAEEFMNMNPCVDISVQGGGSGVGIASIIDGTCDIGDASRPIKDKELDKAAVMGRFPKANVVAMDGIAVVVHPGNSVSAFDKKQIKDIYTGSTSNWSDLGFSGGKIVVVSRDTASGTYEAFNGLVLDGAKVRADALVQASNRAVAATVAQTPCSIGYVGLGYVDSSVKALEINGVMPSKKTVLSGEYMLSRPLFMYTNGKPNGIVKDFIDFILSSDGQKIVEKAGFIGLK